VTGQTTHVGTIVLAALPIEMGTIHRMAGEARLIEVRSGNLRRVDGAFGRFCARAVFGVLVTVAVAAFADRSAGIVQKLSTLTVKIEGESFNDNLMALTTISADDFLLGRLRCGRLR